MDRQPVQMTIWLLVPPGSSIDPTVAAVLLGAVGALSATVVAAGEIRSDGGSRATLGTKSLPNPVPVAQDVADDGGLLSPCSSSGDVFEIRS
jgi:hypothetical protein